LLQANAIKYWFLVTKSSLVMLSENYLNSNFNYENRLLNQMQIHIVPWLLKTH